MRRRCMPLKTSTAPTCGSSTGMPQPGSGELRVRTSPAKSSKLLRSRLPRGDQVLDTLSKLNDRHRILLVLHHIEGQSVPEIAEALGEGVRAIESALARARRRFRTIYERSAAS